MQHQKHTLQNAFISQTRVIVYSGMGLLNMKWEIFKFLLFLCEEVYFFISVCDG